MVYNSARCKMKKSVFFIVGVIVAMFLASGCTKVVTQSTIYEASVAFNDATGKQQSTQSYTELKGQFSQSDAVLVYMKIANVSGDDLWMPLPLINGNELFEYAFTDNGIFAFTADAGDGYTWTNNFTNTYRIIKIPRTALVTKSSGSVNTMDYNEVMKEYNLYEAPVIRK